MPKGQPKAYDAFIIDGQRYDRVGERTHTRRDGQLTILYVWQAECRQCGHPFIVERPDKPVPPAPNRRCKACIQADPHRGADGQLIGGGSKPHRYVPEPETEQDVLRPPIPAVNTPAPPVYTAPASVNSPSKPASVKRKGVFTDR